MIPHFQPQSRFCGAIEAGFPLLNAGLVHGNTDFVYEDGSFEHADADFVHSDGSFVHTNADFVHEDANSVLANADFVVEVGDFVH